MLIKFENKWGNRKMKQKRGKFLKEISKPIAEIERLAM